MHINERRRKSKGGNRREIPPLREPTASRSEAEENASVHSSRNDKFWNFGEDVADFYEEQVG
jgi:hypothetical protein